MNNLGEKWKVKKERQALPEKKMHGNTEYPKQEDMARVSIHNMNLKEKRLETGKRNIASSIG